MDPNETLRAIRDLCWQFSHTDEPGDMIGASSLVELIEELDRWLSKGGFLPDAWGESR